MEGEQGALRRAEEGRQGTGWMGEQGEQGGQGVCVCEREREGERERAVHVRGIVHHQIRSQVSRYGVEGEQGEKGGQAHRRHSTPRPQSSALGTKL